MNRPGGGQEATSSRQQPAAAAHSRRLPLGANCCRAGQARSPEACGAGQAGRLPTRCSCCPLREPPGMPPPLRGGRLWCLLVCCCWCKSLACTDACPHLEPTGPACSAAPAGKRPLLSLGEDEDSGAAADEGGEGASGRSSRDADRGSSDRGGREQRHYRGQRIETPSHPGGVSDRARESAEERQRRQREREREGVYASTGSGRYGRDDRGRDERGRDDRYGGSRRDERYGGSGSRDRDRHDRWVLCVGGQEGGVPNPQRGREAVQLGRLGRKGAFFAVASSQLPSRVAANLPAAPFACCTGIGGTTVTGETSGAAAETTGDGVAPPGMPPPPGSSQQTSGRSHPLAAAAAAAVAAPAAGHRQCETRRWPAAAAAGMRQPRRPTWHGRAAAGAQAATSRAAACGLMWSARRRSHQPGRAAAGARSARQGSGATWSARQTCSPTAQQRRVLGDRLFAGSACWQCAGSKAGICTACRTRTAAGRSHGGRIPTVLCCVVLCRAVLCTSLAPPGCAQHELRSSHNRTAG